METLICLADEQNKSPLRRNPTVFGNYVDASSFSRKQGRSPFEIYQVKWEKEVVDTSWHDSK
eukprot:CAMPEP_0171294374 /NCGR_PEP_ID=MMETSP0816-20121228/2850_1 /TAXON_ID=420281 /ORGANISM="Proboscia inermis, Strain CCAP1064/1" /LENGTH=61 /DNA_ID=CAMNT_0011766149 /DNA_START=189 /DNA_END=374 /DNA_ORIENTATION=-